MDIKINQGGTWVTVERNVDVDTPDAALSQFVSEMYSTTDFRVLLTESETLSARAVSYRNESDNALLELLCDEVLPQLTSQLTAETADKLNTCLAARLEIKQRYPKPA
ncbi:hypothetical protein [Pseudoalteromonas peptidolytica]|uniref:hypothetical protein n=1 Tax=Pseudoalteromonas peptidolytica TaxID=61150 RepID=UPI00298DD1A3|nr:hypothetical protein [Pseudoalteromonas peptidolytica]MDW7548197.1 hypothetical protein [Pseudoalteromonas peptidolytica]